MSAFYLNPALEILISENLFGVSRRTAY